MADKPAWVKNAADPAQVSRAKRKERDVERVFLESLKTAMQTYETRLVLWELLSKAGVFGSVWHNSALIHYNAGRQDFGHELMAKILEADEAGYELMQREARERARKVAAEQEAVHTRPSGAETT